MGGRDQNFRAAVVDNIFDFVCLQAVADRRKVDAGTMRCPTDLEEGAVVFQSERDTIAAFQAQIPEQMSDLVRNSFQFAVADGKASVGHDISWTIGVKVSWVHI